MPVRFEKSPGNSLELIPAPLVSINKSYIRDSKNNKLRPEFRIRLTGTAVNIGSSLDSPGTSDNSTFGNMNDILAEQERIRNLFSNDGGRLEIEAPEGGGPNTVDCYCIVDSVNFSPSTWTARCEYTVELITYELFRNDGTEDVQEIEQTNDSWSIQENPNGTVSLTHTLSAVGVTMYSSSGINDAQLLAKTWCQDRSHSISDGEISPINVRSVNLDEFIINTAASGNYWNMSKSERAGIESNSWEINETFIYNPSGTSTENYSVSLSTSEGNPFSYVVNVNGQIAGYSDNNNEFRSKSNAASGYWESTVKPNLFTRISSKVPLGYTVNPSPISTQISFNETEGTMGYTYVYNASSGNLIENSSDESINIVDTGSADVFAEISVPGRTNGPVVQYMNTKTLPQRSVSITATIPVEPYVLNESTVNTKYLQKPNTDSLINALKPSAGKYYITQNTEEFNPLRGAYSRTVAWTLNTQGLAIDGIRTGIENNT